MRVRPRLARVRRGGRSVNVEIRPATTDADWAAVQSVRRAVFVVEQAVPEADEWDAWDAAGLRGRSVHHLLAEAVSDAGGERQPVGAARWRAVDGGAKLERFAVVASARGAGLGRRLVARALADARAAGHRRFVLHAQTYVAGLYASFGFRAQGEPFDEDGLEHVKMTLAD